MNNEKKTADELLFEEEIPKFRSMVVEGALINDTIQKNKI
jgi:hypothetical protein